MGQPIRGKTTQTCKPKKKTLAHQSPFIIKQQKMCFHDATEIYKEIKWDKKKTKVWELCREDVKNLQCGVTVLRSRKGHVICPFVPHVQGLNRAGESRDQLQA